MTNKCFSICSHKTVCFMSIYITSIWRCLLVIIKHKYVNLLYLLSIICNSLFIDILFTHFEISTFIEMKTISTSTLFTATPKLLEY